MNLIELNEHLVDTDKASMKDLIDFVDGKSKLQELKDENEYLRTMVSVKNTTE